MSVHPNNTPAQPRRLSNPAPFVSSDALSTAPNRTVPTPGPLQSMGAGKTTNLSDTVPGPFPASCPASCPDGSSRATDADPVFSNLALRLRLRLLGLVAPQAAARRGVELYCTPRPAHVRAHSAGDPNAGAKLTMLQVDGHELATHVWGDPQSQPYVLLAHGWSSHALRHLAWVAALRTAGYAVVAFDQQAHGCSSGHHASLPEFVCNLLAVGWHHGPAAAVIGHDLGGAAAAIALNRGLQAERAVLIAAQADPLEATIRFSNRIGLAGSACRRMVKMLELRSGLSMDDLQAHRIVPRIGRPALVVHDLEDKEVPWAEGERYARCWQDARLLTTTGLGHQRIAQNPQVIVACLRFLKGKDVGERIVSSPNLPYGSA